MPATISTTATSPIVNASSSAVAWPKPMSRNRLVRSGSMLPHAGPPEKPSNDVVPMIRQTSATVPGTMSRFVRPLSGLRTNSPSRVQRSGDIRAMSPKYTPKPSP